MHNLQMKLCNMDDYMIDTNQLQLNKIVTIKKSDFQNKQMNKEMRGAAERKEKMRKQMNETPMNMIQERIEELNRNLEETEKKMKVQNKDYRKEMHRKFKKMPKVLDLCLRKHK